MPAEKSTRIEGVGATGENVQGAIERIAREEARKLFKSGPGGGRDEHLSRYKHVTDEDGHCRRHGTAFFFKQWDGFKKKVNKRIPSSAEPGMKSL